MKLQDLAAKIGATVISPGKPDGTEVTHIYAGDRVSDLLNQASEKTLLVSNLASVQMLRVAELMDVPGICFVGNIRPDAEMVDLAKANKTLRHGLRRRRLRDVRPDLQRAGGRSDAGRRGRRPGDARRPWISSPTR